MIINRVVKVIKNENGISLVELICSLAVLSIISSTLISLYIFSAQIEAKASAKEHALSICEEMLGFYDVYESQDSFQTALTNQFNWKKDIAYTGEGTKYDNYYDYRWNSVSNEATAYYKGSILLKESTSNTVKSKGTYANEDEKLFASKLANSTLLIEDIGANKIKLTYGEVREFDKSTLGNELVLLIISDTAAFIGVKEIDSTLDIPVKILLGERESDEYYQLTGNDFKVTNPGEGVTITEKVRIGTDQNIHSISIEFFKKDDDTYKVITKENFKYGGR